MESLHSRKLSNATTFSSKTPYAGVFSAHRHSYAGASTIDAQDYREIFGSSPAATSIPVLDLSTLGVGEASDGFNLKFRSSKPDYSKIFGGFRDEDVAVSYEELFASDKARAPSSTTSSSSPDSDNLSHQSSDALKQFNMSYNKISPKSKDGLDGNTRHVTKLHAIPGFTRFIDEEVPPLMETEKHEDSSKNSKHGESFSEDKFSKKVHPAKISPPSASPTNVIDHKDYPKRSTAKNSESCKTDTSEQGDEELDVNSAASALKKAIEKAQESIRIAKESVGRKKKGLRSSSSKTFKDSLKVEEHKYRDEVRASSQVEGRNRTVVFPDFMNGEKLSGAKKVMDEIHEKFSESNKECLISVESSEKDETEIRPLDSDEKDESATFSSETVDTEKNKTAPSDFLHTDQTDNMSEDYKSKIKEFEGPQEDEASVQRLEDFQDSEETIEVDMSKESEEVKDEVISSNTHELVDESINLTMSEKVEDEEKASEEEILEQEHIENAENATESIQESEKSAESCDDKLEESEVSVMKHEDCDQELEKTSIDQTSSEENEDEQETEENDVESESSSSREEEEESNNTNNTQLPHKQIPEMEVNEETHKEMERKKERLAVERAIREARERARERSERAAVEKATQEIRQRMMADAQQKAAKASAQSKLRAERAAVERATSEARQRALMKAMSQKNETTVLNGISSESALRSKAKLEKHNRIMERAAKALAEKEKRDLLAQKEQAERNRLAENLDADIKRWSNGKEGNLRALLSTLQYILGSQSGWEAVSLTEIVATSAVKKAYRKATLCVHPDKLQQRGASIQHKYICEKVFDLLKAAWNKFNSEER